MDTYLTDILRMGLKNRKVSLVANGTWAPVEMKLMKEKLSTVPGMKILPTDLTILSALTEKDREVLGKMADEIVSSLR
jgi:flavorubredoxin